MVTLYEYLGKPAGKQLAKDVCFYAIHCRVKKSYKDIWLRKKGKQYPEKVQVFCYEKEFLDHYFNRFPEQRK